MRVFGVVLLACIAIGAYAKSLDELERRVLLEILKAEARSGSNSQAPECECQTDVDDGVQRGHPRGCDLTQTDTEAADYCSCVQTCIAVTDDDGENDFDWDIGSGDCRFRCEYSADLGATTDFPRNCAGNGCTCELTCSDVDGEYKPTGTPDPNTVVARPCPDSPPPACDAGTDPTTFNIPMGCADSTDDSLECKCILTCGEVTDPGTQITEYKWTGEGSHCPPPPSNTKKNTLHQLELRLLEDLLEN